MACAKLKQLIKGMTRHSTNEKFQWVGVLSSTQLQLGGGVIFVVFTWYFIIWLTFIAKSSIQNAFFSFCKASWDFLLRSYFNCFHDGVVTIQKVLGKVRNHLMQPGIEFTSNNAPIHTTSISQNGLIRVVFLLLTSPVITQFKTYWAWLD